MVVNDVTELTRQIRRRTISSRELTEHYLQRIEHQEPDLQAHITVCADRARVGARRADDLWQQGLWLGPLHGIPAALKDLVDTAGVRTTAGSAVWEERVPAEDAEVWSRLTNSGAHLLGKHNLHEFAYGTTSENERFGTVHNPWDLSRTAGGSSGGSAAAVAADLSPFSIGTDTGGSIRIPAACTGIYGLKPTYGRVSVRGVAPLAFSLDHVGPLARSVRDTALLFQLIAGFDPLDPSSVQHPMEQVALATAQERPLAGMRIGVGEGFFAQGVDAEILLALKDALRALEDGGAKVEGVMLPLIEQVPQWQNETISAEAFAVHRAHLDDAQAPLAASTRARLETGRALSAASYAQAQYGRMQFRRALAEVFRTIDVLITPTLAFLPPVLAQNTVAVNGVEVEYRRQMTRFTNPFNFSGNPAFAVPYGRAASGLPISLQLVAAPFAEARLFQVGAVLEAQRPFAAPPASAAYGQENTNS